MKVQRSFEQCPYQESLVLMQAVPVCCFDDRSKRLVDRFLHDMLRAKGAQQCGGLPAACVSSMSCAEALAFIDHYGDYLIPTAES